MKYEVIGHDDCCGNRLTIESVDYSWDKKTTIIHVKLPKIKGDKNETHGNGI